MAYGAGAGAAAAAAVIADAIKASGVLVRMEPREFERILERIDNPLIVVSESGVIRHKTNYLTSYKGLAFYADSETPLRLPDDAEVIQAKKIYIPG